MLAATFDDAEIDVSGPMVRDCKRIVRGGAGFNPKNPGKKNQGKQKQNHEDIYAFEHDAMCLRLDHIAHRDGVSVPNADAVVLNDLDRGERRRSHDATDHAVTSSERGPSGRAS